jgi:hypothetical protein
MNCVSPRLSRFFGITVIWSFYLIAYLVNIEALPGFALNRRRVVPNTAPRLSIPAHDHHPDIVCWQQLNGSATPLSFVSGFCESPHKILGTGYPGSQKSA